MGLFGGSSKSKTITDSSTTVNTSTVTEIGSIGISGSELAAILQGGAALQSSRITAATEFAPKEITRGPSLGAVGGGGALGGINPTLIIAGLVAAAFLFTLR